MYHPIPPQKEQSVQSTHKLKIDANKSSFMRQEMLYQISEPHFPPFQHTEQEKASVLNERHKTRWRMFLSSHLKRAIRVYLTLQSVI